MGVMANPLYIDLGFSLAAIATVVKLFGVWMTILGAIVGGLAVARFGILRALLIGGVATATGNLIFAWLATQGQHVTRADRGHQRREFRRRLRRHRADRLYVEPDQPCLHRNAICAVLVAYALPGKLLGGLSGHVGGLVRRASADRRRDRRHEHGPGPSENGGLCAVFPVHRVR